MQVIRTELEWKQLIFQSANQFLENDFENFLFPFSDRRNIFSNFLQQKFEPLGKTEKQKLM